MKNTPTRGGTREGAGRKASPFPAFNKKLRATDAEREEFMSYLMGDSRLDFVHILNLLRLHHRTLTGQIDK